VHCRRRRLALITAAETRLVQLNAAGILQIVATTTTKTMMNVTSSNAAKATPTCNRSNSEKREIAERCGLLAQKISGQLHVLAEEERVFNISPFLGRQERPSNTVCL